MGPVLVVGFRVLVCALWLAVGGSDTFGVKTSSLVVCERSASSLATLDIDFLTCDFLTCDSTSSHVDYKSALYEHSE